MKRPIFILAVPILFLCVSAVAPTTKPLRAAEFRALWVDCEGRNRTLGSKAKIVEMLETAERTGCTDVIVQVSRGAASAF